MSKCVLVISYDQPGEIDAAVERLSETADKVRSLFENEPDLKVHIAIRESADEVLRVFDPRKEDPQ